MATYVLIPGAGGDGWQWHLVARELEARGHDAIPITLPSGDDGAGWKEYADAVVEAIGGRRDLVLVAQSLAGFTAPLVCERLPVDLLVLLNAMIPMPGETGNDWWGDTGSGEAQHAYLARLGLDRRGGPRRPVDLLPRRARRRRRRGLRSRRAAAVDDADVPAVPARRLAGRPDPGHRRPRRPPLPARVPAPCRARAPRASRPTNSPAATWSR